MSAFQFVLLEPNISDAEAVQAKLTAGGIDCKLLRVDNYADFVKALATNAFDLILSDYTLNDFDGISVLDIARKLHPETPFIFVSASVGEELAIAAFTQGAAGFVLKHRLEKLVPCVQRALQAAQKCQQQNTKADSAIDGQTQFLEATLAHVSDYVYVLNREKQFVYANRALEQLWGLTREEYIGKTTAELGCLPELSELLAQQIEQVFETKQAFTGEVPYANSHGEGYYEYILSPIAGVNRIEFVAGVCRNTTERRRSEEALRQEEKLAIESEYLTLFESIDEGFCICQMLFDENGEPQDYRLLKVNSVFEQLTGLQQPTGKTARELIPNLEAHWFETYGKVVRTGESVRFEQQSIAMNRWFDVHAVRIGEVQSNQFAVLFTNISDRKQAELALTRSKARLHAVAANLPYGAVFIVDRQLRYLLAEGKALEDAGMTSDSLVGKTLWEALEPIVAKSYEPYYRQALSGEPFKIEHCSHNRYYVSHGTPLYNDRGEVDAVLTVSYDISDRKKIEQERERFLAVASDLQAIAGNNGYFQWVSPTFEEMLGWTTEEMLSRPWTDFIHPDDISPSMLEVDRLFCANKTVAFENRYLHKNGSYRWLLWKAQADLQEQVLYGAAIDITERKKAAASLRESESRFRFMVESATDYAIFTLDLNGIVTSWNSGAERMLRYAEAEIIGQSGRIIYTPEDREKGQAEREMHIALTQGKAVNERWHVRKDNSYFWGSGLVMPLQDEAGTTQGFVKIMQDKTAQRQAEAQKEQVLQREQAAREAAENANRIKNEFLAVLSHELRSPLNPILGWIKLLQKGKLDSNRQAEALKIIERNAILQSQLIEDLLDISRIMQGKLSLNATAVNLKFVISAAVETVRLAAEAKNISILLDLDEAISPVSGDAARLQQVLWNLLTNAVKFTPNGGQIIVELRQLENLAQIRVIDTGKGIQPQFLPYVFDYFRQEDGSTTRKFGGLGLGLAIVRQIVEMHGGTVKAESLGEDRGATFTVELPILQQTVEASSELTYVQAENKEHPLSNVQILVVDDDSDTREFQAFLLEQNGARVTTVSSAFEALQAMDSSVFDVLVSDVGMAQMDGYMLMQKIRSRSPDRGGQVRAIAVTAYARDFDRQQALQAGFQAHITKPIDPDVLLKAIVNLLDV